MLFNFLKFVNFHLLQVANFIQCGHKRYFVWFLSFKLYWNLICGLTCGLSWKTSHVHFRKMCVQLCAVLYMSIKSSGLLCCLNPLFSYLLSDLSSHCCEWCIEVSKYYYRTAFLHSVLSFSFFFIYEYFNGLSLGT